MAGVRNIRGSLQKNLLTISNRGTTAIRSLCSPAMSTTTQNDPQSYGSSFDGIAAGVAERNQSGSQASFSGHSRGSATLEGDAQCGSQTYGGVNEKPRNETEWSRSVATLRRGPWKAGSTPALSSLLHRGASSCLAPTNLWQSIYHRQYETRGGEPIELPSQLNRRGKKLVQRRAEVEENDDELLADTEGMEQVGLEGLRWMRTLANTPRRKQEAMLVELMGDMFNPTSPKYLLFKSAAEGIKSEEKLPGREEGKDGGTDEETQMEFEMQIVDVNRTSKATKGGRLQSMTALVIVGNGDGVIGYGSGKALEPGIAVDKAYHRAVQNLLFVPRYRGHTIYHPVEVKYGQTKVRLWPAEDGENVVASKTLGGIASLAGIRNLKSKIVGSRHPQNVVKAVFKAFASIQTPTDIAQAFHRPVVEVRNMPFR